MLRIVSEDDLILTLEYEDCGTKKNLRRDKYSEIMWGIQKIHNRISASWAENEINPRHLYDLKMAAFDGILLLKTLEAST
jgi:hypothetical protein